MKLAIVSTIVTFCCALFVSTNAYTYSCQLLRTWNSVDEFPCTTGNDVCTLKRYECDSIVDCPDKSDEDHCAIKHASNCMTDFQNKTTLDGQPLQKFKCVDGMCILGCERCDGKVHCLDGSDENGCTGQEVRPPCN